MLCRGFSLELLTCPRPIYENALCKAYLMGNPNVQPDNEYNLLLVTSMMSQKLTVA